MRVAIQNLVSDTMQDNASSGIDISSLLSKPQESNAAQGWVLYKEILGSGADDLTLSLLDLLYAATIIEDYKKELVDGEWTRKPFKRLARQPDEKRICPSCKIVQDNYSWEICDGFYKIVTIKEGKETEETKGKTHTPVETQWLHWRPLLTEAGFRAVRSQILMNVGKTLSTGNFKAKTPEEARKKLYDYALGVAADIDEVLFVQPEWVADSARFSRSFRVWFETTLAQNVATVMSRSTDGWLGNRMTQQTTTHYDFTGKQSQYQGGTPGIVDKVKSYLSL